MVKRLSKSAPFLKLNELNIQLKKLEAEAGKGGPDAEVRTLYVTS